MIIHYCIIYNVKELCEAFNCTNLLQVLIINESFSQVLLIFLFMESEYCRFFITISLLKELLCCFSQCRDFMWFVNSIRS